MEGKELNDIKADPGQKNDIAAGHPEVVEKLLGDYETSWTSLEPATEHNFTKVLSVLHFSIMPHHSMRLLLSKQPYHHLPPCSPLPPLSVLKMPEAYLEQFIIPQRSAKGCSKTLPSPYHRPPRRPGFLPTTHRNVCSISNLREGCVCFRVGR